MSHSLLMRENQQTVFEYLIEDWISSAIVEKYLLKALAIVIWPVKVNVAIRRCIVRTF